uniref:Immunoglobulin V-set domain-containing protein n=1 Tax=Cyprinodon variegatus TaxID=28743 RepID=A0A3Q2GMK0_CYPVA
WQKVRHDEQKNLATYTKKYGHSVRIDLVEKMDFQCEDLQSCSMVIRKVMEEDEGCYKCLFNTYPRGALIGRTCLRLYGEERRHAVEHLKGMLHEPVLDVSRSESPAESQNLSFSHYNSSSVTHSNGTVTVTTTALLSASSSTQVGCSVSVLSAAPREKLLTVHGHEGEKTLFIVNTHIPVFLYIFSLLAFGVLVALLAIFWFRRKNQSRYYYQRT